MAVFVAAAQGNLTFLEGTDSYPANVPQNSAPSFSVNNLFYLGLRIRVSWVIHFSTGNSTIGAFSSSF